MPLGTLHGCHLHASLVMVSTDTAGRETVRAQGDGLWPA